jgi:hypothetical protein
MALSFEDELRSFLEHKYEQMPEIQEVLVRGRTAAYPDASLSALSKMVGTHNEALLLVAMEIDKLRASIAEG